MTLEQVKALTDKQRQADKLGFMLETSLELEKEFPEVFDHGRATTCVFHREPGYASKPWFRITKGDGSVIEMELTAVPPRVLKHHAELIRKQARSIPRNHRDWNACAKQIKDMK